MNTPTPRTDSTFTSKCVRTQIVNGDYREYEEDHVPADFARQLERELSEANEGLTAAHMMGFHSRDDEVRKLRDEVERLTRIVHFPSHEQYVKALKDCDQWRECAERLAADLNDVLEGNKFWSSIKANLDAYEQLKGK